MVSSCVCFKFFMVFLQSSFLTDLLLASSDVWSWKTIFCEIYPQRNCPNSTRNEWRLITYPRETHFRETARCTFVSRHCNKTSRASSNLLRHVQYVHKFIKVFPRTAVLELQGIESVLRNQISHEQPSLLFHQEWENRKKVIWVSVSQMTKIDSVLIFHVKFPRLVVQQQGIDLMSSIIRKLAFIASLVSSGTNVQDLLRVVFVFKLQCQNLQMCMLFRLISRGACSMCSMCSGVYQQRRPRWFDGPNFTAAELVLPWWFDLITWKRKCLEIKFCEIKSLSGSSFLATLAIYSIVRPPSSKIRHCLTVFDWTTAFWFFI